MPVELSTLLEGMSLMTISLTIGLVLGFLVGFLSRWSLHIINKIWEEIFAKEVNDDE